MSDSGLTAALQALRLAARRSAVARRLDAGAEQDLLQTIVEATVALFEAEACSIALFEPTRTGSCSASRPARRARAQSV